MAGRSARTSLLLLLFLLLSPSLHSLPASPTTVSDLYKYHPPPSSALSSSDSLLHSELSRLVPSALEHTGAATFDEHLKGVQAVLRKWRATEAVASAGLFHSIYGTEGFQGYKLPMGHRSEIREVAGERSELLAWIFCVVDRHSVDLAVFGAERALRARPELGRFEIAVSDEVFWELVELTLADWLEQVESASTKPNSLFRWKVGEAFAYRRPAYAEMARVLAAREPRLAIAREMHEAVMAEEGVATRRLVQER